MNGNMLLGSVVVKGMGPQGAGLVIERSRVRLPAGALPGRRTEHITPVLQSLYWLPVRQRILFKVAVPVHQCLNWRVPSYLADDCRWIRHRRAGLRSSSDMMKLDVPLTRTTFGDRSFAVNGPRVWNSLPASIRDPTLSLSVFSNGLKTRSFNSCGVCDLERTSENTLTN